MGTNKILLGGIAGAVLFFLLGWIVYGMLLMDYMAANTNQCMMKPMEEMNMGAMAAANLAQGLFMAMLMSWTNTTDAMKGAKIGAIAGLLICLAFDLQFFAMSTFFSNVNVLIIDCLVATVMMALGGAVIAWVMGMGKKSA